MSGGVEMPEQQGFVIGLHAGMVGRWVRLILGAILPLYVLARDLAAAELQSGFYLEAGAYLLAVFLAYLAAHYFLGERFFARINPWLSTLILLTPVIIFGYIGFGPAPFRVAVAFYVAFSLIFNFAMSYGGCEVLAIPSLLLGRRYVVYCPWNVVDAAERAVLIRQQGAQR